MELKSTVNRYGTMAISLHWLSAILILAAIGTGFRAAATIDLTAKAAFLRVHLPIAVTVLLLTAMRIVWWWLDRKPGAAAGSPHWQQRAAETVHVLFYVVVLGVIASGIGMIVLSGAAPIIFGEQSGTLPDFWKLPPRLPHAAGARLLVALLVLHTGAALYHHFVLRDDVLRRIWFRA